MKDSDAQLVEGLRSGDPGAFEELYRTHFRRIHNFSLRRIGDPSEAEDITQEVFLAVFSCIDRFEGKSDLVVWIYGITRNILNNRLRRRGGTRLVPLEEAPAAASARELDPEALANAREALERVQHAIDGLPPDQRRILELRHGRRLAIRRIARIMARSEDAVKSSLYRTRRTLSASLPDAGAEPSF